MRAPPRVPLAHLPTPLAPAPRLSEALGVEVLLKRDDLTGVGLGGNKARSVEFHLGAAGASGADVFLTGGGPRSNWVLIAAAGAASKGLPVELVLFGERPPPDTSGVDLLDRLAEVRITFTGDPARPSVDPVLEEVEARLRAQGRRPYVVGRGGAGPVGALGYVAAVDELDTQLDEIGVQPRSLWLAVGSCGTIAGVVAGYRRRTGGPRIIGVSVHRPLDECRDRIERISEETLDMLGIEDRHQVDWSLLDRRHPDPEQEEAAALMARTEGIFLDPEYGACTLAALAEHAGEIAGPVVLLLTGGTLNLFRGSSAA